MPTPGLSFCKVMSIKDEKCRGQIMVAPMDGTLGTDKWFYSLPLLPKVFHVKPKEGEGVFVFFTDASNSDAPSYYIGPVIGQDHKLLRESADFNILMKGWQEAADVAMDTITKDNIDKLIPRDEDVVVRGRKSSEMQFTNDDVRIKAGVRKVFGDNQYTLMFNQFNPAFMKLKYHYTPLNTDGEDQSTATIVADKINLFSQKSTEYTIDKLDPNDLITDEKLADAINSAYRLPYGEKLVELLKTFIAAFKEHTHKYIMLPPTIGGTKIVELNTKAATLLDDKKLLSDTIRIN